MIERSSIYMMEEDARLRLKSILTKLRNAYSIGKETKSEDDSSSVEHHIQNIIKVGGGLWNESCAKNYIEDLEAFVGKEAEAHTHYAY